ncbi:MAG: exosortase/archaeosortase family protein [Deltaproteobacteria bacterium]|nr:exosortase/archaeosortase family protein [Deltaproteobacteria bacterium]
MVLALFVVGYYPALTLFVKKWLASDDYTHAFFIVPVIVYMIWLKREMLADNNRGASTGLVLVVLSLLLYLLSLQMQVPTLIFLATVITIITAFIYLAGFSVIKELAIPILLLFMIIPIPNQLLSMLTASLQLNISAISVSIVQLFSVPIFREGNVLQLQDMSFQVVEACSGIRSLISMTTLSILIGYFTLTRARSIAFLFLFSIPVAIVINIIRVVVLVLVFHYLHIDLSVGTSHTVAGLVLFVVGLALLFAFQRVLELWETAKTNN